jgi:hypothetical protein
VMFRTAVAQKAGCYRPAFEGAEDYDLWLRMAETAGIAILPEYLLQYRAHPASVTVRARLRQMFSARLAQWAAQHQRSHLQDPTAALTGPPDWHDAAVLASPAYGDLARLFRFLDLANVSRIAGHEIDIAVLGNPNLVLNHAERGMAQLALLNVIKQGAKPRGTGHGALLWRLIRLHPLRAAQFGYRGLLHADVDER